MWNTKLQDYIHEGQIPDEVQSMLHHVKPMIIHNIQDQMSYLCSISNYHWWQYIRCDGTKSKSGIHVRLTDHLLYHPNCEQTDEHLKLKYIPESPRNRLMYFCYTDEPGALKSSITQLLKLDKSEESPIELDFCEEAQKQVKRRRYATHILKVSPQRICEKMGVNFTTVKNSSDMNRNLYSTFSQQLITDGVIKWRKHNDHEDIVMMSDYNPSTGNLSPLSYVHVTCIASERGNQNILLKCTCQIYNTIQCAGLSGIDLSQGEDVVLDESMTCMHCRFFRDHLVKLKSNLHTIQTSSMIDRKVKSSLPELNNPVVLVGLAAPNATTKISVMHEDTVAMIHINFNRSNSCFAKCQNGECIARLQNKKRIPKCVSIEQNQDLCGHIQTLFANFEIVNEMFPEYFSTTGVNDEFDEGPHNRNNLHASDTNMDDEIVETFGKEDTSNFDASTGCWKCNARSNHKPKQMNDLELAR